MEKLLICLPVVKNPDVLAECVAQIMYKREIHLIILLNGADQDVKDLLYGTYAQYSQILIWENKENVFVTAAWNRFMEHFLMNEPYNRIIIINSDLTLQKNWDQILRLAWEECPDYVITPNVINDKTQMYEDIIIQNEGHFVVDNPPGIFITLDREQCELVYPIPSEIRVWFNDTWIMGLLKAVNTPMIMVSNLLAFHHVSTSVNSIGGIHEVIEEDKIAWTTIVKPRMEDKIKQIKNDKN